MISKITFKSAWAAKLYADIPENVVYDRDVFVDFVGRIRIDLKNQATLPLQQAWEAAYKLVKGSQENVEVARKRDRLYDYVRMIIDHLTRYYDRKTLDGPVLEAREELDKPNAEVANNAETFFNSVRLCSELSQDLSREKGVSENAKQALQKLSNTAWSYVEAVAVENEAATRTDYTAPFSILKEARGLKVDLIGRPDPPRIAAPRSPPVRRNPNVTIAGSRPPPPSQEPPTGEPRGAPPPRIEPPPTGEPRSEPPRIEDVEQTGGPRFAPPPEPQNVDPRGTWEQLDELERQGTWDQWDAVRLAD
jgi:hypothetical protein